MSFVQLKCPNCGESIQLDETKEYGFCNYCGTRVIQDKVIVEHRGSVSIDNTDELNNLYILARRAKESNDTENAQKYYEKIIVMVPTDWEANFYTVYYQASNCVIAGIVSAATNLNNNLSSTFQLIKDYVDDSVKQREVISEVVCRISALSTLLIQGAVNHFNSIDANVRKQFQKELDERKNASINLCYSCGDYIESYFGNEFIDLAIISWKDGVDKSKNKTKSNPYCIKIKKYDPSFKIKKSNFVKFGIPVIWFVALCLVYAELGNTWGLVYFILSLLALIGYIVWNISKKRKNNVGKP